MRRSHRAPPTCARDIPHIAEAAERDRAQLAAHDVAQMEALPSAELIGRRDGLRAQVRQERTNEDERAELEKRIERVSEFLGGIDTQRERAKGLSRKLRRSERERIDRTETRSEAQLAQLEAELRRMPPVEHTARRELVAVEQVLDERLRLALVAAHLAPPVYITEELGERPSDPTKRKAWERGVRQIEGYRQGHGIKDRERAFGAMPKAAAERAARRRAQRQLQRLQRNLGRKKLLGRSRNSGRSLGMGR